MSHKVYTHYIGEGKVPITYIDSAELTIIRDQYAITPVTLFDRSFIKLSAALVYTYIYIRTCFGSVPKWDLCCESVTN